VVGCESEREGACSCSLVHCILVLLLKRCKVESSGSGFSHLEPVGSPDRKTKNTAATIRDVLFKQIRSVLKIPCKDGREGIMLSLTTGQLISAPHP